MPSHRGRLLCGVSAELDSSRWIKISKGLDDFRFGPPSPYAGRILPASPAIIHESSDSPLVSPDFTTSYLSFTAPTGKELSSTLSLTSKISLSATTKDFSIPTVRTPIKKVNARTKQKKHVQSIEQKLKENPLILFPYLESDIPHEVFEKLMSILGPEQVDSYETLTPAPSAMDSRPSEDKLRLMRSRKLFSRKNVIKKIDTRGTPSAQAVEEAARHIVKGGDATNEKLPRLFTEEFKKMNEERGTMTSTASVIRSRRPVPLDQYRSFLKRINYSSDKAKKKTKKADIKLPEESLMNVRQVAEDFCNWMQTIGGEDAKFTMDVDKVLTLFAMNAELESMQTTSNVLDEFPLTAEETEAVRKPKPSVVTKTSTKPTLLTDILKAVSKSADFKKAGFIRYRYGAWYLDINEWKKLKPDDLLEDPEEAILREKQEATRCSDELDKQLSTLHTYKALTSFIRRNNLKVPNFLQYVKPPSVSNETFFGKTWSPEGRKRSPYNA